MISISVYKQGNYPVNAQKIKEIIKKTLKDNGVSSDFAVSVALVGREKMEELVGEYYDDGKRHLVLAFPSSEMKEHFVYPPKEVADLGDIVISYPYAVDEAKQKGRLISEVVCELAEHATLHLLGIHHE